MAVSVSSCGPRQTPPAPKPSTAPAPTGNQPPVISSLAAAQSRIYPSGTIEIQCNASDPNGDRLNFSWSATSGNFNGTDSVVTWHAPKQAGTYTITVAVDDGKGGSAQRSLEVMVGINQNPQITSLLANPLVIGPGDSSLITCIADDPDGDTVKYSWKCSDGNISGVGNKITWFAPNKGGTFNIIVAISDGKGGETQGNVSITVAIATKTITINVIPEETGTVNSKGDKDRAKTRAGDDENNIAYRAFWSFNIWSLNGTVVKDARLTFTTRNISGNPFAFAGAESLGGMHIWNVSYTGQLPDYDIVGTKLDKTNPLIYDPPTVLDVTPEVSHLAQGSATRFQIEVAFSKSVNGNGIAEWIEWSYVKLEVTYTEK